MENSDNMSQFLNRCAAALAFIFGVAGAQQATTSALPIFKPMAANLLAPISAMLKSQINDVAEADTGWSCNTFPTPEMAQGNLQAFKAAVAEEFQTALLSDKYKRISVEQSKPFEVSLNYFSEAGSTLYVVLYSWQVTGVMIRTTCSRTN